MTARLSFDHCAIEVKEKDEILTRLQPTVMKGDTSMHGRINGMLKDWMREKKQNSPVHVSEAGMSNLKQTITRVAGERCGIRSSHCLRGHCHIWRGWKPWFPAKEHTHAAVLPLWGIQSDCVQWSLLILHVPHCSWPPSQERCIPWQGWKMKGGSTLKRLWFSLVHLSTHVNWYILVLVHMHLYHRASSLAGGGMWGDTAHHSGFRNRLIIKGRSLIT